MTEITLASEIHERKSVTNWSNQPISEDVWEVLFEAARRAPSSWNHQPARYVVVTEASAKKTLTQALHRCNGWADKAAGLVVQFANPEDDDRIDGRDYYLYDCGLAMMSLIYQAQCFGISARQMLGFDEVLVKQALCIPAECRVTVITGLGYPSPSTVSSACEQAKRHITSQHKRYHPKHTVAWQSWEATHR